MVCYGIKNCELLNELHFQLHLTQRQLLAAEATINLASHRRNLIFTL